MSWLTIIPLLGIQFVSCVFSSYCKYAGYKYHCTRSFFFLFLKLLYNFRKRLYLGKDYVYFLALVVCSTAQSSVMYEFSNFTNIRFQFSFCGFLNFLQFDECKVVLNIYFNSHYFYSSGYIFYVTIFKYLSLKCVNQDVLKFGPRKNVKIIS